jgi:6-phosphofructokinase 1
MEVITARSTFSELQNLRKSAQNLLPVALEDPECITIESHEALGAVADHDEIKAKFPHTYGKPRVGIKKGTKRKRKVEALRIGVVLSGGQAPGGHNVIAGIYDYVKKISPSSSVIGFLNGPIGVYTGNYCEIDDDFMDAYRNSGGFDMIGSGRHKIEKPEQFEASLRYAKELNLDGLVVIGGDDSNTNAAILAEYFASKNSKTKVCGCPKTIDGDLKVHPYIPISFGFDTACRTYSELIGNLGQDALSSQKYYHFVRLMGRSASHIALECALQTRPNICIIGEETELKKQTLSEITENVCSVIEKRAAAGKNYGIILIPEGLIEFIPEFNSLISEINDLLANGTQPNEVDVMKGLSAASKASFSFLPASIKMQLMLDRDPHGNVQVAKIETEKLLALTVESALESRRTKGVYKGMFNPQFHSYGYEGRSGLPSHFDSTYCYVLGQNVAALISMGERGLVSSVTNLDRPVSEWGCGGVPITMMCNMEKRHGHMKPVIKKALVELDGAPFKTFEAQRDLWALYDLYRSPGPIQFYGGDTESKCELAITLALELGIDDSRMSISSVNAAIALQENAKIANSKAGFNFVHAPLYGSAMGIVSPLQETRRVTPELCPSLHRPAIVLGMKSTCRSKIEQAKAERLFPSTCGSPLLSVEYNKSESIAKAIKVGVVFAGRPAPGGHDVIAGIFDALPEGSTLIGFVGGTEGLLKGSSIVIKREVLEAYKGQGGFELLGRGSERLKDFEGCEKSIKAAGLSSLVLVGGSRTNSDATMFNEYLVAKKSAITIATVPVDITGSIKNEFLEATVGFDTATKVASQIVGNNATDGASAKKYYYFMRLIGQEPSHVTLEVALSTKPNYVILGEEVKRDSMSLSDIIVSIADAICIRADANKNYGTVVIPEGLIEEISEMKLLVAELEALIGESLRTTGTADTKTIKSRLTVWSRAFFDSLPDFIQEQLFKQRQSNNTLALSQLETEKLLAEKVMAELSKRKESGTYNMNFSPICSFIGYQARGSMPTKFDSTYAYNLGAAAVAFITNNVTGYMAAINGTKGPTSSWKVFGIPLTAMLETKGSSVAVLKSPVDLSGEPYRKFQAERASWIQGDMYENPGPVQFHGPSADSTTKTLALQNFSYLDEIEEVQESIKTITDALLPGCDGVTLSIAHKSLNALASSIRLMKN